MSKKTWVKWGALVTASTVAALQVGACIAEGLLQYIILRAVD